MSNTLRIAKGIMAPDRSVAQVRCIYENMGDIFVYQAINKLLKGINIISFSRHNLKIRSLESVIGFQRIARFSMLGGGTLIFAPRQVGWGSDLDYLMRRTIPLCTFGTGVIDPDFLEKVYTTGNRISPLDTEMITGWIEYLRQIPFVGIRGVESERLLRERGFTGAEVIGDPAIVYAEDKIRPKLKMKKIGVNILDSSNFWPGSKENALKEMQQLIVDLAADRWEITLFPASHEDFVVANNTISRYELNDKVTVFLDFMNVEAYIEEIASMDIFVGMRLHSFVAACCSYTPAIMVGYQPKCIDFTRTIGLERFHIRTDEVSSDAVMEIIRKAYGSLDEIQLEQYGKCQHMKDKLTDFSGRIQEYIRLSTI